MTKERDHKDWQLFIVVGSQRTGTTLLREILNSNDQIAMVAEVMIPYPAPSHWNNFVPTLPPGSYPPPTPEDGMALLDRYFNFVRARIRDHWTGGKKNHAFAIGVDIKCNQLRSVEPVGWSDRASPFLLHYARERQTLLINCVRKNALHCALSALIGSNRDYWHNYDGRSVDKNYVIDIEKCLGLARWLVEEQRQFERDAVGCRVVTCDYDELVQTIGRAGINGDLSKASVPLSEIADALRATCDFRYDGKLQKAINRPYGQILSNHASLKLAIQESEFSNFASTID